MMKHALLVAAILCLVIVPAAPAAKAGPAGTIIANQPGDHHYSDALTYTVTTSGLKGYQYPMVGIECYQDANGDGLVISPYIIVDGKQVGNPDLVWLSLDHPDATFYLGSGSSNLDISQSATCFATLYAYGWKGGQESIVALDSLSFTALP